MGLLLQSAIFLFICCLTAASTSSLSDSVDEAIAKKNREYELYFNKGMVTILVNKLFAEKFNLLIFPRDEEHSYNISKDDAIRKLQGLKATGIEDIKINTMAFSNSLDEINENGEMVFTYKGDKGEKTVKYEREWVYVNALQEHRISSETIFFK